VFISDLLIYNAFCYAASSGGSYNGADPSQRERRGMVLPFEPHSIAFDDVVYSVDMPQVSHFQSLLQFKIWFSNNVFS